MNELTKHSLWTNAAIIIISLLCLGSCGLNQDQMKISALTHFKRGNEYYKQSRLASSAEEYKRAIALDPDQDRFYYNLGLVYYSLHLYDQAIKEYWNAIELNPLFREAWFNLALAFEKVDETEKAFMAYEKYKKLGEKKVKSTENTDESVTQEQSSAN